MSEDLLAYAAAVPVLVAGLVMLVQVRTKAAAGTLVAIGVAAWAAIAVSLGKPRPIGHEIGQGFGASRTVVAAVFNEPIAIYLWIRDGNEEPTAYKLPWDLELAKQLRRAQQGVETEGGKIKIRLHAKKPEMGRTEIGHWKPPVEQTEQKQ
jgi:hypothetical protein